jgi:hypothetical protein
MVINLDHKRAPFTRAADAWWGRRGSFRYLVTLPSHHAETIFAIA